MILYLHIVIPSHLSKLKKVYLNISLYDKISSSLYDSNGSIFSHIFLMIILSHLDNIGHPALFNDWIKNLGKSAYI